MVERPVQLVDGAGAERVAHLGSVERDADGAVLDVPVVSDVGKVEAGDLGPRGRVENLGDILGHEVSHYAPCLRCDRAALLVAGIPAHQGLTPTR